MSVTALQTVSCGMLKATEMVLTRIRMIFADMVAEPHSVASIALTECRRGSGRRERPSGPFRHRSAPPPAAHLLQQGPVAHRLPQGWRIGLRSLVRLARRTRVSS